MILRFPAHEGINGNEKADQLAKQATLLDNDSEYCIPFTDYRDFIRGKILMRNDSILRDQGSTKGKIFFENYHRQMDKQWFYNECYCYAAKK